jgi:hypothetical protein
MPKIIDLIVTVPSYKIKKANTIISKEKLRLNFLSVCYKIVAANPKSVLQ